VQAIVNKRFAGGPKIQKPAGAGLLMLKTARKNVPKQNGRFWGFVKGAISSSSLFLAKLVEVELIGASRDGAVEKRRRDALPRRDKPALHRAQDAVIVRTWGAACCAPTCWWRGFDRGGAGGEDSIEVASRGSGGGGSILPHDDVK
jgi:hypothetical protein